MCQKCNPTAHCLWCADATARLLPFQRAADGAAPMFCTLFCAARFAAWFAEGQGAHWCAECQQWHTSALGCGDMEPARFCLPKGGGG